MERKELQPLIRWNQNRAGSILLLGISLTLIAFSIFFVFTTINNNKSNHDYSQELKEKEREYEGIRIDIILAQDEEYQKIQKFDNKNNNENVIKFK